MDGLSLADMMDMDMMELGTLFAELEEMQRMQEVMLGQLDGTPSRRTSSALSARAKLSEGRLFLGFEAMPSRQRVQKYGTAGALQCTVEIQGTSEKVTINLNKNSGPGSVGSELVFHIHEYYGLSRLRCAFSAARLFGRPKTLGSEFVTLRDIVSSQVRPPLHSQSFSIRRLSFANKLYPCSDSTVYWGFERTVQVVDPVSGGPLDVCMYGRYVPLRSCLELRLLGGIEQTELHLAASRAPQHVVEELLAALSREGTLSNCLRVRCRRVSDRSSEGGDPGPCAALSHQSGAEDTPGAVRLSGGDVAEKGGTGLSVTVETVVDVEPDIAGLELTPLEAALQSSNSPAAKALLQRAGNFCFEDIPPGQRRNTPIHSAVRGGADALRLVMRFLSLYGSRQSWGLSLTEMLEARDEQGRTPLMLAALLGRTSLTSQFLKMPVSVSTASGDQPRFRKISKYGKVVISSTAILTPGCSQSRAVTNDDREVVAASSSTVGLSLAERMLQRSRPRRPPADHEGDQWTALMYAAAAGHVPVARELLAATIPTDVDDHVSWKRSLIGSISCAPCARSKQGMSAMMLSAEFGRVEMVELLMLTGVPLRAQCRDSGNTVLHIAAAKGHIDVCRLLIAAESVLWGVVWGPDVLREKIKKRFTKLLDASEFAFEGALTDQFPRLGSKPSKEKGPSVLHHMRPKYKFIQALNFRGLDAAELAVRAGHPDIAELLHDAAQKLYHSECSYVNRLGPSDDQNLVVVENVTTNSDAETGQEGIVSLQGGDMLDENVSTLTVRSEHTARTPTAATDDDEEITKDRDAAEHAAYLFALAAVPRQFPPSSGTQGFLHMDLDDGGAVEGAASTSPDSVRPLSNDPAGSGFVGAAVAISPLEENAQTEK